VFEPTHEYNQVTGGWRDHRRWVLLSAAAPAAAALAYRYLRD
jgi:uncharacterized protein involved in exopolysaccharide biosynthesis